MHYKVLNNTGKHKDESKNHPDSPSSTHLSPAFTGTQMYVYSLTSRLPSVVHRPAAKSGGIVRFDSGSESQFPAQSFSIGTCICV